MADQPISSGLGNYLLRTLQLPSRGLWNPQLSNLVVPVVELDDKDSKSLGNRTASWTKEFAALAANQNRCQIRNPADSGLLIAIDKVRLATATAGAYFMDWAQGANLANVILPRTRRGGAFDVAAMSWDQGVYATPATAIVSVRMAANTSIVLEFDEPLILDEQFCLQTFFSVVNTIGSVGYDWRRIPKDSV